MRAVSAPAIAPSRNPPVRPDSDGSFTVQSDSDDSCWFKGAARALLGSDPGLALHVLTGCSESSGYRYASGTRDVPEYVVRQLLRSPQGWQWLCALMEGSTEQWWRDVHRARRLAEAISRVEAG